MKRHIKTAKPEKVTVGNVGVKIYHRTRKDGYPVWEVADYSAGTRKLRSFSDHSQARKEAERIARLMAAGEVSALDMRPNERASYGRALELLRETGVPLEIAAGRYAEAFKLLGGDRLIEAARFFLERNPDNLPTKTVAEVVGELLATKEARGKSVRYLQDLRHRLTRFAEAFQTGVANVTTGDLQRWLDGLKVQPRTYLNFRRVAGTLFSYAEARGYIFKGANPLEGTERIEANGHAVEIYRPSEMTRLLAAASPEFRPCLALAGFAGLRSAEIERLDWSDVDLAGRFITVAAEKSKTASRRLVPISENLAAWLAPYARQSGRLWKGKHDEFYDAQQDTAAATRTEDQPAVTWKANALRHSFASYRLAETGDAARVALECGNSPAVVFKHYRELVKPDAAKQWFSIQPEQPANVIAARKAVA
ncbi:MAG: site-specific integrase [Verrucomicrobiota bacterium]